MYFIYNIILLFNIVTNKFHWYIWGIYRSTLLYGYRILFWVLCYVPLVTKYLGRPLRVRASSSVFFFIFLYIKKIVKKFRNKKQNKVWNSNNQNKTFYCKKSSLNNTFAQLPRSFFFSIGNILFLLSPARLVKMYTEPEFRSVTKTEDFATVPCNKIYIKLFNFVTLKYIT